MRTVKNTDAVCKICGATRQQSLEIFEIMFTEKAKLTICDLCNNKLLYKTLRASCKVNERIKNAADFEVIRKRREKGIPSWYFDKTENKKQE